MPEVKDSYDNEAEAQLAADKMQAYTDEYEAKRKPTRRQEESLTIEPFPKRIKQKHNANDSYSAKASQKFFLRCILEFVTTSAH